MSDHSHQRLYPAAPDAVFAALVAALPRLRGRVHSVEQFGTAVLFSPTRSGPPAEAKLSALVLPREQGAVVEVTQVRPAEDACDDFCPIRLLDEIGEYLAAKAS